VFLVHGNYYSRVAQGTSRHSVVQRLWPPEPNPTETRSRVQEETFHRQSPQLMTNAIESVVVVDRLSIRRDILTAVVCALEVSVFQNLFALIVSVFSEIVS